MTEYNNILLDQEEGIATVSINRPEVKNALGFDDCKALVDVFMDIAADDDIKVVIFTGAGGTFCAGADLVSLPGRALRIEDVVTRGVGSIQTLLGSMEKPVIAVVEGHAAGVGMSLALGCDLMVMGESARLFSPFAGISLVADGGSTWFLRERLGYQRAYEFFIESQKLSAQECMAAGIANRVVADADVQANALAWAKELAQKAPLSLKYIKRLLRRNISLQEMIAAEGEMQNICITSQDCEEGVIAFMEKREPNFKGK